MSDGQIIERFKLLYPEPKSELNFKNAFELAVAVALSAQCTDKKVNEVTKLLFKRFPSFRKLAKADISEVEQIIGQVNYYRTKSKHITEMAKLVVTQHAGELPRDHLTLTTLPGVGRKTANVICSELGITPAFPVDTHVFRVAKRLGLAAGKNVREVENEMCARFPSELWRPLHHYLILHGRRICKAQTPLCELCSLSALCPSARV